MTLRKLFIDDKEDYEDLMKTKSSHIINKLLAP